MWALLCLAAASHASAQTGDSFSNRSLLSGDVHQHAGSVSQSIVLQGNVCNNHQFGHPLAVYDAMRDGGYAWGNIAHHTMLLVDRESAGAYQWWIDPANDAPFPDARFAGWFWDPDFRGLPDYVTGEQLASPTAPWSEPRSMSTAANARNDPGSFVAYSGREYTTFVTWPPGAPNTGGHKVIILPEDTDFVCGADGSNQDLCKSEYEMYRWVHDLGGAVLQAHPSLFADPHLHPETAPGGMSDAFVYGMELGTTRVRWQSAYLEALARGFRVFPAMGSDLHNRPEGCQETSPPGVARGATLCWSDTHTRAGLLDAMRERRCYYGRSYEPRLEFEACDQWNGTSCTSGSVAMGSPIATSGGTVRVRVRALNDPRNFVAGDPSAGRRFDTLELVDQSGAVRRSCPLDGSAGASPTCRCARDDASGLDECLLEEDIPFGAGALYPRVSCAGPDCAETCAGGENGDCRWLLVGAPIFVNWDDYKTQIGFGGYDDCDFDADGIACWDDNCPLDFNPGQEDPDQDGVPTACADNCPNVANPLQGDANGNGLGDLCELDADDDGLPNASDNCLAIANPDQGDVDADGVGDVCDNCPSVANADQADDDDDGVGQVCDNCTAMPNPLYDVDDPNQFARDPAGNVFRTTTGGQLDDDADGFGNVCDARFVATDGDVDAADDAEFGASLFKLVFDHDCGTSGSESCDKFDLSDASALPAVIETADADAFAARIGAPPGPRCAACPLECQGDACDADGDGLTDAWEDGAGTNPGLADSDGDGDSDLSELVAGSDPLDAGDDVSPVVQLQSDGNIRLSWPGVSGGIYMVMFAPTLPQADPGAATATAPAWSTAAAVIGNGSSTSWIDTGAFTGSTPATADQRLYALRVYGNHPETGAATSVQGTPVGFVRISLAAQGFTLAGMPFIPEDASVHAVLGNQLDGAGEEPLADRILHFDSSSQSFQSAYLFDSQGQNPAFDGRFFDESGESAQQFGCGRALLIENRGAAQPLVLSGRVERAPQRAVFVSFGDQYIAPCYAEAGRSLDDYGLLEQGALGSIEPSQADRVMRFDSASQSYQAQYLFDSGTNPGVDGRWFPVISGPGASFTIEPGHGYLYRRATGAPLIWKQTRPYALP